MTTIIIIALLLLAFQGVANKVADWGNNRTRKQAELGRKVQSATIVGIALVALFIWGRTRSEKEASSTMVLPVIKTTAILPPTRAKIEAIAPVQAKPKDYLPQGGGTLDDLFQKQPPVTEARLPSTTEPIRVRRAESVIRDAPPPGTFLGIGVTLEGDGSLVKVAAVSAEGPAQLAGIRVGARLLSINGTSTRFATPDTCTKIIRASRSPVTVEIRQPNEQEAVTFRLYKTPLSIPR